MCHNFTQFHGRDNNTDCEAVAAYAPQPKMSQMNQGQFQLIVAQKMLKLYQQTWCHLNLAGWLGTKRPLVAYNRETCTQKCNVEIKEKGSH